MRASHPNHGKIVPIPPGEQKRFGKGTLVIPKPLDVDALVRKVRSGLLTTPSRNQARLAADCGADHACPLSTGIFIRIVAEAAEEDRQAGKKRLTPFWRIVKEDGALNEKFPGGANRQATLRRAEGFAIDTRRRKGFPRVKDFEESLAALS